VFKAGSLEERSQQKRQLLQIITIALVVAQAAQVDLGVHVQVVVRVQGVARVLVVAQVDLGNHAQDQAQIHHNHQVHHHQVVAQEKENQDLQVLQVLQVLLVLLDLPEVQRQRVVVMALLRNQMGHHRLNHHSAAAVQAHAAAVQAGPRIDGVGGDGRSIMVVLACY
jgi:hypothetical protein